jgi:hypothetical protein
MRISRWSTVDTRWYLGVHCRKCGAPILFALDHSDGEARPAAPGKLLLTCVSSECRHQADYSSATISRFQKEPVALTALGKVKVDDESR